jgi:DNA-binding HxlR family transcriptional regulator
MTTRITWDQLPGRPCSVAAALELVGERWSLLVVRELMLRNRRFSQIAANTGAPRDVLTNRLRSLEAAGVIERRQYSTAPPRSEYHLTAAGRDLQPVIQALLHWGDRWAAATPPAQVRHHGHTLELSRVCRTCGEEIEPRDVSIEPAVAGWTTAGRDAAVS